MNGAICDYAFLLYVHNVVQNSGSTKFTLFIQLIVLSQKRKDVVGADTVVLLLQYNACMRRIEISLNTVRGLTKDNI